MIFTRNNAATLLSLALGLCFTQGAQAQPRVMEIVGTGDGIDVLRTVGSSFTEQENSVRIEVSPSIGSTNGGTKVTILGSGFATGATVAFGSVAGVSVRRSA